MTCHRIRFEREEIDLRIGATLLGRDESCTITLHDPQISRLHALILADDACAVLRDLGSRNGTRVNGEPVVGDVVLCDGDHVALAERGLVYCRLVDAGEDAPARRPTERRLRLEPEAPFSGRARLQTPTLEMDRRTWWTQLQLDLLDKAVATARFELADEIFERIASACEGREDRDEFLRSAQFDALVERLVARLVARQSGAWLAWVLDRLREVNRLPPASLVAVMSALPLCIVADVVEALDATLSHWSERSQRLGANDATLLSALIALATDLRLSGNRRAASSVSSVGFVAVTANDRFAEEEDADGPLTRRGRSPSEPPADSAVLGDDCALGEQRLASFMCVARRTHS